MNPDLYPREQLTSTTALSPSGELKLSSLKNDVVRNVSLNRSMSRLRKIGGATVTTPTATLSKNVYTPFADVTPSQ